MSNLRATIVTTVLGDGSEVYDLLITQGDEQIQIAMGSIDGCMETIAVLNNHAVGNIEVAETLI